MRGLNRGFTLIEMLGVLAVGALMTLGVVAMIDSTLEDSKGQQAALYQSQITAAAIKYINANYATLQAEASASPPAMRNVDALKAAGFLSSNFNATNPYGQTPCILVQASPPALLNALVVTEGGTDIATKELAYVAANAGQGGGYISSSNPTVAQGAFNSWSMPLAGYISGHCSSAAAGANHLASAVFFSGPGQLSTDFVYRASVPGRPDLNQMTTPLNMRAQVDVDTSDTLCIVGDTSTYGRIAVDSRGAILSCQVGVWKRQIGYWKDPKADFASLPTTGNELGDVRLTLDFNRAYSWSGISTGWIALAVDELGNLRVPGRMTANDVLLKQVVVKNTPCTPNGLIAREATGMLVTCASGSWRGIFETRITTTALEMDITKTPSDGTMFEDVIDLTTLPGTRPLYVTGYSYCNSNVGVRALVLMRVHDAAGNVLGYNGGCGAKTTTGQGVVLTKDVIGLQKIPENAATLHIRYETGSDPADYVRVYFLILNSE